MSLVVNCPTCGQAVAWREQNRWRPFCSERCRLIDLGQWADESHRIPGAQVSQHEEGNLASSPKLKAPS